MSHSSIVNDVNMGGSCTCDNDLRLSHFPIPKFIKDESMTTSSSKFASCSNLSNLNSVIEVTLKHLPILHGDVMPALKHRPMATGK